MGKGSTVIGVILGLVISLLILFCIVGGHSVTEIPSAIAELPQDVSDFVKKVSSKGSSSSSSKTTTSTSKTTTSTSKATANPTSTALSADAKKAKLYSSAIEPRNSAVRSFALGAIKESSAGSYNIDQICDIYDKLYKSWVYVNDPAGDNYVAKASESVKLMRGDCEDYAILMASCIEAIGGTARIVSARNSAGDGHAYAEVWMTKDPSAKNSLINSISKRYGGKTINWHTEPRSDGSTGYWLNLDWTASHPGGKFFQSTGTILIIRSNGNYVRENFKINN